jgi:hypothetical protein
LAFFELAHCFDYTLCAVAIHHLAGVLNHILAQPPIAD